MKRINAPQLGLAEFYLACYTQLVGALALIAGGRHEAEDALQEAFVRLVPRWEKISHYDDPQAWVRRVAINVLSTRRRRDLGWAERSRLLARDKRNAVAEVGSDVTGVMHVLRSLPVNHRQVIVLRYLFDMTVDDIASELAIPVGTVKSRLARARTALGQLINEETENERYT